MQLLSPDILLAAKDLSIGASGFLFFVGFLLWAFGWRWHKFWVVFGITTLAGVIGLSAGQAAGGQVMAIGILLAFAGGVMALEVAKILAFGIGGVCAWLSVQTVLPAAQEMWAVFLAGGLFGVILYRLWTMILTSFFGVLVSWHAAVTILGHASSVDAISWIREHSAAMNGAIIAATFLGILVQVFTSESQKKSEAKHEDKHHEKHHEESKKDSWWEVVRQAA